MPYICKCCGTHQPGQSDGWCGLPTCRAAAALAFDARSPVSAPEPAPSLAAPLPEPTLTNAELLALIPDGGRYEVRCVDEERVCLLLLSAGDSLTAAKLTSAQAVHLSGILFDAAVRLEPTLASRSAGAARAAKCLHRGTLLPAPDGAVCTVCGLHFPGFTPGAGGGEAPR